MRLRQSSSSVRWWAVLIAALAVLAAWGRPAPVWAAGQTTERESPIRSLRIVYDYRWAGHRYGGYYPVRMRIQNAAEDAELTFRFQPDGNNLPAVVKPGVVVESNSTVETTLLIPMHGLGSTGVINVSENGEPLELLGTRINLPDTSHEMAQPSLLILSPTLVDGSAFTHFAAAAEVQSSYSIQEDFVTIEPRLLPRSWLAYSGLDFVAAPLNVLKSLGTEERTAIVQWVQTGGNLIVYKVGADPRTSAELAQLLGVAAETAGRSLWQSPNPRKWQAVFLQEDIAPESAGAGARPFVSEWDISRETFAYRDVLLGQVFAFEDDPFPGTSADWAWMASTMDRTRWRWPSRHGLTTRYPTQGFLEFLIPGVAGVPVFAFIVLMTLFTVIIGPLNYVFFRRRGQTYMLLLTIPLVAFLTSLTLFGYSLLANGFGVDARIRSLTVLDQSNNTSVNVSRVSLFAGMAPSDGLKFSLETAVEPLWQSEDAMATGSVIWAGEQTYGDGWFRSRTRTQFYVTTPRPQRGRLEITPASGEGLKLLNGLEWDVEAVVVADANGKLYAADAVEAGAGGTARPADVVKLREFSRLLTRYPLELPDDVPTNTGSLRDTFRRRRHGYYGYEQFMATHPNQGRIEMQLKEFERLPDEAGILPPNTYLAILVESPDVDMGLEDTTESASYHVLWGRY